MNPEVVTMSRLREVVKEIVYDAMAEIIKCIGEQREEISQEIKNVEKSLKNVEASLRFEIKAIKTDNADIPRYTQALENHEIRLVKLEKKTVN